MFEKQTSNSGSVIRRVSIVESFYNPLDKGVKEGFRQLWMKHFNMPRESFYRRIARPNIEEYALIVYYLQVNDMEFGHLQDWYKDSFRNADGTQYPTYKDYLPNYLKK